MPPRNPTDNVAPLVERANHLEVLIVSNLLGFLLTATSTMFAAIYALRSGTNSAVVAPLDIIACASALYLFLSGYYYFMLAQFYSCIITLIPHAKKAGIETNMLWNTLRIPSVGIIPRRAANIAMLASVPLLPLVFSILSLIFLRFLIEGHGSRGIGILPTTICILLQVVTCVLMITEPFREFIKVTVGPEQ
jgi:hypothetical protein